MSVNTVDTKEHFDKYRAPLADVLNVCEEGAIKDAVDSLLGYLYQPNEETAWRADGRKLKRFGMNNEAINWGDLYCASVEKLGEDGWLVTIEEASPEAANLCRWVQDWLGKWGWPNVRVQAEW
jgi:hypothetical protein